MTKTNPLDLSRQADRISRIVGQGSGLRAPAADAGNGQRPLGESAGAGLLALLKLEADVRAAGTLEEFLFVLANETFRVAQARQCFVFRSVAGEMRLVAVSGLATVDRSVPLVRCMEETVDRLGRVVGLLDVHPFDVAAYADQADSILQVYPFRAFMWLPFVSRSRELLGGMLLAREPDWSKEQIVVGKRLAATYSHALQLLVLESRANSGLTLRAMMGRKSALAAVIAVLAAGAFPVSMTTLAPFEIVAREPFVVAAPIDGVIASVLVDANEEVREGQPLVAFSDTVLRNQLDVAEREVLVADARVRKATQMAFEDPRGRQDLGLAVAELALKTTERDFSLAMLGQAAIAAPRAGTAIYADKQALIGKPVSVGERIMLIADPASVEVAIDVSVGDSIALKPGARAKLFLDSDPMNAREAVVTAAGYLARPQPGNVLAFRVVARLTDAAAAPRPGTRGTAQLYGGKVWLAFYLFRRPFSAFRQWTGL